MRLGNISLSRMTISVWLFVVIMSYAPVLAHYGAPWFDYSEYYFSVNFLNDTALQYFQGLAQQGGVVGVVGQVLTTATYALQGIMILLEGVFTGLHPTWKLLGFDKQIPGREVTLATILSGFLYLFYFWTLYEAYTKGVET